MKNIYFIRHAKSSWDDSSLKDFDRPLNNRGLRDAPFMAKLLAAKGIKPDAIVASPANRAFTTSTFFAQALGINEKDIVKNIDIYEAFPEMVLEIIQNLDKKWETVLIFGHNPTFTSLANRFHEDYIPNVPTCGIVHVSAKTDNWADFSAKTAKREGFYYPKQYFV